jgi:hypothetical protein
LSVVIKAHISSLNNKLKKKMGLGSSGSYIFFSPGVAVNDEFIKLFEDSDDENEFEGFGPEDLIPDYEILREIDLQQSLKDRNVT